MGVWNWVFGRKKEQKINLDDLNTQMKSYGINATRFLTANYGGDPPVRGSQALISAYNEVPKFKSVIKQIAYNMASTAWEIGTIRNVKTHKSFTLPFMGLCKTRSAIQKKLANVKDAEFVNIPQHPLLTLMDTPNSYLTAFSIRFITFVYLDIFGEAFWYLEKNDRGIPAVIWPIPPHWVAEVPKSDRRTYIVNFGERYIKEEDMIWFKEPNPVNPYGRSSGTGVSLADELDTDEYAARLTKAVFYNSAIPSGIVGIEGMEGKELERFANKWNSQLQGVQKQGMLKFVNSKIDYQKLDQDFDQLKLLPLRAAIRDTIRQSYGVPPEILGILESSNRATIVEARYIFAILTLIPRLELFRDSAQTGLVNLYDNRLILQYEDPTPDDVDRKLEIGKTLPWTRTRNEWREAQGLLPDPDGDVYVMPTNLMEEGQRIEKSYVKKAYDDLVDPLLESLRPERLIDEVEDLWSDEISLWGNTVLADLNVEVAFNMLNPEITRHLNNFAGDKITEKINETTKKQLRETLIEGVRAGEGTQELKARVKGVFKDGRLASDVRAHRIARTEVHNSAEFATQTAYKQSGVVDYKRWAAALVNSRPDHIAANANPANQKVSVDGYFSVGGEKALYPGDSNLSAAQSINCQCISVAVILDPVKSTKYYREHYTSAEIRELQNIHELREWRWARRAIPALRKGFISQEKDMLEAIEKLNFPVPYTP